MRALTSRTQAGAPCVVVELVVLVAVVVVVKWGNRGDGYSPPVILWHNPGVVMSWVGSSTHHIAPSITHLVSLLDNIK